MSCTDSSETAIAEGVRSPLGRSPLPVGRPVPKKDSWSNEYCFNSESGNRLRRGRFPELGPTPPESLGSVESRSQPRISAVLLHSGTVRDGARAEGFRGAHPVGQPVLGNLENCTVGDGRLGRRPRRMAASSMRRASSCGAAVVSRSELLFPLGSTEYPPLQAKFGSRLRSAPSAPARVCCTTSAPVISGFRVRFQS